MGESERKREYAVMPLLYFEADWGCDRHDFAAGLSLIRAEPETVESMTGFAQDNALGGLVLQDSVEWLLATVWRGHPQDNRLAHGHLYGVAEWFVAALNLVKANCAVAPCIFKATMAEGSSTVEDIQECDDYGIARYDRPVCHWPEPFAESDVELLRRVWDKLSDFLIHPVGAVPPSEGELPPPETVVSDDGFEFVELAISIPYVYETFDGTSHSLLGRSRLGRALALFEQGTHLPRVFAFISMFVVLETLFAVNPDEDTSRHIEKRLAGLWGLFSGAQSEAPTSRRIRQAYDGRKRILHGHELMDAVPEAVQKNTFALVRETLRALLLDDKLFDLYNSEKTSDDMLKRYLRDLGEMNSR